MRCTECHIPCDPDRYTYLCNLCGDTLVRQYETLQEFCATTPDLSVVAGWVVFGVMPRWRRAWVVR